MGDERCQQVKAELDGIHGPINICTLDKEDKQDTCANDSGGPLVARSATDPGPAGDVLVGVVSFGPDLECGQNEAPRV